MYDASGSTCKQQLGFTLLELLLVVAIGAMVVTGVVVALPSAYDRHIDQEAQRVAALLESARARSRSTGETVYFRTEGGGFRFSGAETQRLLPSHWLHAETAAEPAQLVLGPEPVIAAQQVLLKGGEGRRRVIATNGVHPFAVVQP